jgi:hypothetical protein
MTVAPEPSPHQIRLRLGAALVAFAAGVGAIVTIVLLAHSILSTTPSSSGGSTEGGSNTSSAGQASFPNPPEGSLVLARQDRDLAVAIAASPTPGGVSLQASVIGQEGPADGLQVSFDVESRSAKAAGPAAPCGVGCYETRVTLGGKPERVAVEIGGRNRARSTVSFRLPAEWPPPDAADIVHRAERTWRALRSLVVYDHLASGPGQAITTHWRLVAPDREAYVIEGGPRAVVIGAKRWDRNPGGKWVPSAQDPIRQPVPFWLAVADAHLLGSETLRGSAVWHVSFFDPQIRAWFELWIEKSSGRTLELRMTAQAHFMHQVYGQFDRPLRVVPPTGAGS